jgi:hypothetical protein
MASTTHMATVEDDRRHLPGPNALPLWSESYWFPMYDPEHDIGVVLRAGMHMKRGDANLYLFVTHRGAIVHTVTEQRAAPPPLEGDSFTVAGLRVDIERPLERFRLRYAHGSTAFDLTWEGMSPTYKYPTPPSDEFPGHIEQGGRVTGRVTLGGVPMPFDGPGHRDHSWGGERDWAKFHRWTYLSGEFGGDFWFNAVRIHLGEQVDVRIGCLWDGRELLSLQELEIEPRTVEGGSRQTGVEAHLTDEHGRAHHIVGEEVVANCPVWMGRTVLKDGITRFRSGDRIGWGIHEHGFIERDT